MKFFFKIGKKVVTEKELYIRDVPSDCGSCFSYSGDNAVLCQFTKFLIKNGQLTKSKLSISIILKKLRLFLDNSGSGIVGTYPIVRWVTSDLLFLRVSPVAVFNAVINLVKPPFVVAVKIVPKKLKRRIRKKFTSKIVYKDEIQRIKSSFKQLQYYSQQFADANFKVRLYKALMFSFLDWKDCYLVRLKATIFRKFFKM